MEFGTLKAVCNLLYDLENWINDIFRSIFNGGLFKMNEIDLFVIRRVDSQPDNLYWSNIFKESRCSIVLKTHFNGGLMYV